MKIALIANHGKKEAADAAVKIIDLLLKNGHEVFVNKSMNHINTNAKICNSHFELEEICEFFIAVGGDGTIIHTAKHSKGCPILGVNLGRLGYMAGLELADIENLPKILQGDYYYEDRMLISISINNEHVGEVLNDGVISGQFSKILDYEVSCENSVFKHRADGLIVATPTGSTAYSMSAGGPVVDPTTDLIIFTPICPHSLFNRSVIFNQNSVISVKVKPRDNEKVYLTLDGGKPFELNKGDEVTFKKSENKTRLIMANKKNFFELVNKKLLVSDMDKSI
ncbi:MAG: NAD(+)/NADH kinase [Clostridia bacterium]